MLIELVFHPMGDTNNILLAGISFLTSDHSVVLSWALMLLLAILGLVGCVLPILPGHILILLAAGVHRLILGDDSGLNGWSFVVLVILLLIAQWFEWASGAVGVRWFGGSKWGAWGALLGAMVGMFFFPFGLILGPFIGAFVLEKWGSKKNCRPALVSGVGSAVGATAGLLVKLLIGLLMVIWLLVDAL